MAWPITGADVRAALKGVATTLLSDADAADYAAAAVSRIEKEIGPRSGQSVTEHHTLYRGVQEVVLSHAAAAVTSVLVDGLAVTGWTFEDPAIVLDVPGPGRAVITWTAPTTVGAHVELAAKRLAAFLVRQDRIGAPRQGNTTTDTPQGYALPRNVTELLERDVEPGGMA